jgi:hypothetical protein
MKEKYCSGCKEKLEDGEIVVISKDGTYHTIIQDLDAVPIDCSMKKAMDGVQIFQRKVYYQGKFYDFSKLDKLPDVKQLTIEFNEKQTGDIIKGNLKGLTKKLFGIF